MLDADPQAVYSLLPGHRCWTCLCRPTCTYMCLCWASLFMWLCVPLLPLCSPVQSQLRENFHVLENCSFNSNLSPLIFGEILQVLSSIVLCNLVSFPEWHSRGWPLPPALLSWLSSNLVFKLWKTLPRVLFCQVFEYFLLINHDMWNPVAILGKTVAIKMWF